ncbi:unnamed protein product [Spirodela intermedia]|uniref:HVA22-like protein n=1 Tax=Spirodela intermedia TaxID=51605 RepID=A0A7I8IRH2_SPIIN|nr:unnamed protein product [Spirodela intermedia]CAA6659763.1 unnamed protein product [Spirodela intermedia]
MFAFLKVVAENFDVFAGPVVSLAYPLYASVRAIETRSRTDDGQWLTYWVLYSFITLVELTFDMLFELLPLWSYFKLALNCWLVLPYFSGAAYVYEHYVRPLFPTRTVNFWSAARKDASKRADDVLLAAEKFIEENGPEALEKLMIKAEKSSKFMSRRSTILNDVYSEKESYSKGMYPTIVDDDDRY